MNKTIYDEALEDLSILVKQANARKLSNDIVASRWGVERITKIIEQTKKQEKLLELYKEKSEILSQLRTVCQLYMADNLRLIEIENKIEENEK